MNAAPIRASLSLFRGDINKCSVVTMEVGDVRVAEDSDFDLIKIYLNRNDGWRMEYEKGETAVWTRNPPEDKGAPFKMIRVSEEKNGMWLCLSQKKILKEYLVI